MTKPKSEFEKLVDEMTTETICEMARLEREEAANGIPAPKETTHGQRRKLHAIHKEEYKTRTSLSNAFANAKRLKK